MTDRSAADRWSRQRRAGRCGTSPPPWPGFFLQCLLGVPLGGNQALAACTGVTERIIIITIFNAVGSSEFHFEGVPQHHSGPSMQRAPPRKECCVKSSPPQSRSCCFCLITHSKQLYKMALGFLFPHNLCMRRSIMGSFIMRAAPL